MPTTKAAYVGDLDAFAQALQEQVEYAPGKLPPPPEPGEMRQFSTGATRDTADGKPSYIGFMSPLVVLRFGEYMLKHQVQSDGSLRAPDNWKKGIPRDAYMDSLMRHVVDLWLWHDGFHELAREGAQDALCAILFNTQGLLHELLKEEYEWGHSLDGEGG